MFVQPSQYSRQKHVLLVDPTDVERQPFLVPFEHFGYRVSEASSGTAALRRLDDEFPALIVTEFSLPDFDGLELTRRVRSFPAGGFPSIVGLTSLTLSQDRLIEATEAGFDVVFPKPSSPWLFVTRVDRLLRQSRDIRGRPRDVQERAARESTEPVAARVRAQRVLERSHDLLATSAVRPLMNRILSEHLTAVGITITIDEAVVTLDVDPAFCQQALDELVRLGFLDELTYGFYRRK